MTSFDRRGGVEEASRGGPGIAPSPNLAAVGAGIEPVAGALVAAVAT